MRKITACPLDCYDACSVVYEDEKLKGDTLHPITKGYLCPNLNAFLHTPRIINASFKQNSISIDESLRILKEKIEEFKDKNILYYKGQGNFGVMQNITGEFFKNIGATLTKGSLCDSSGEAGVKRGRGESLSLSLEDIKKSEVVVVWGRNISNTNSHLLPFLKDKTLIVIDPVKIDIAVEADLFIQIEPNKDLKLAILIARFILMQGLEDEEFIEQRGDNYDYFLDFIRSFKVKDLMIELGISAKEINFIIDTIKDKRTIFLVGVGVQKYKNGSDILHMIDSLAAMLGLFGKKGCGVSYLSNSSFGFELPFREYKKREPIVNVDFSKYDLVFIQGSNPANQMPNSKRVIEGLKNIFVVYFGLYENETSKLADLVIPAKSFLAKDDIRLSYAHDYLLKMPKLIDEDKFVGEYELYRYLQDRFGFSDSLDEKETIREIVESNSYQEEEYLRSSSYKDGSYCDKFYTDDELFYFIDEIESHYLSSDGYYLITPKAKHSLNSQFKRSSYLYISSDQGYSDGDRVLAKSEYGSFEFGVMVDDRLRRDCVLIYSGTNGVNFLTSPNLSFDGECAVFQDIKIFLEKI